MASEFQFQANLRAKIVTNYSQHSPFSVFLSCTQPFLLSDLYLVWEFLQIIFRWESHIGCVLQEPCALCSIASWKLIVLGGRQRGSHLKGLHKTPLNNQLNIPTKNQLIFFLTIKGQAKEIHLEDIGVIFILSREITSKAWVKCFVFL